MQRVLDCDCGGCDDDNGYFYSFCTKMTTRFVVKIVL